MPFRLCSRLPPQCDAVTRSGARCSINAASTFRDGCQRLVAEPLRCGGRNCLFHTSLFSTFAAPACDDDDDVAVFFFDVETSGLDVLADEIVEIGVTEDRSMAQFATTVLPTRVPEGPSVHGIGADELRTSARFEVAFGLLVEFLHGVVERTLSDTGSSDEEGQPARALPSLRFPPPTVLLAAHNGFKFDFPILFSECLRHNCNACILEGWKYVDTLEVIRACGAGGHGVADGCARLQCLARCCDRDALRQSHRALHDTIALRDVVRLVAAHVGASPVLLLKHFARDLDAQTTFINRMLVG